MNGWVKGGPCSKRWHQAEAHNRTATLLCSGREVTVDEWNPVMDYRWRPPIDEWCGHPQCQQEVEP